MLFPQIQKNFSQKFNIRSQKCKRSINHLDEEFCMSHKTVTLEEFLIQFCVFAKREDILDGRIKLKKSRKKEQLFC
jgi:hypothetical protein